MVENINAFFSISNKQDNSIINHQREEVISQLLEIPPEFLSNVEYGAKWQQIRNCFFDYLSTNFSYIDINDLAIIKKAGRLFNYDFDLISKGITYKIEFKFNSKSIDSIAEFLNLSEKKQIIKPISNENTLYSNYFYENYLDLIINKSEIKFTNEKPTKFQYLKYIYQSNYHKHPLFTWLKEQETNKAFYDWKSEIVRNSITSYLEKFKNQIDFVKLEYEFERTQNNKHYLMWYEDRFYYDYIHPNQLKLTGEVSIKNGNTYVLKTKCPKSEIHMLLRWKNHLGVLFPAYQIKLIRNIINK